MSANVDNIYVCFVCDWVTTSERVDDCVHCGTNQWVVYAKVPAEDEESENEQHE